MFDAVDELLALVRLAGEEILRLYHQEHIEINEKADHSPVTAADIASHDILVAGLQRIAPGIPIISEEGDEPDFNVRRGWATHWLIDPLDGTKEFIARTDEFTINVALIKNHQPVLGVVYGPVHQKCYWAEQGGPAYLQVGDAKPVEITVQPQREPTRIAVSRRHNIPKLETYLEPIGPYELVYQGSAFKITTVAEGMADLYPRFGNTYEWDTAAGHCVLQAAGGQVLDFNGYPLRYNCSESLLNPEFLAVADLYYPWHQLFRRGP